MADVEVEEMVRSTRTGKIIKQSSEIYGQRHDWQNEVMRMLQDDEEEAAKANGYRDHLGI